MTSIEERVPLWRQLQATALVVQAVRGGTSGTTAIDGVAQNLRSGVQALAFHVWRSLGRAEALRTALVAKKPSPGADALLCTALALAWSDTNAPYDVFTLVNQAVEAAKRNPSTKAQANFINACLRRFIREREALVKTTESDPVAVWNHPQWWIARLQRERSEHWKEILKTSNTHAPMALRVNARKTSPETYAKTLAEVGVGARTVPPSAIVLDKPLPVHELPGFDTGCVSVQDVAAQMAAATLLEGLSNNPEARILDACAAPGGKTGHLLEMSDARVTALEIDPRRCVRIEENLARLGLRAQVRNADACAVASWWDGVMFDAILLDAPCTASGIVRRHPDVRWLRRETDIAQLAALQRKMLNTLWGVLRPGGRLLYCTCSVFLAEGDDQAQAFLASNTDARLLPSPGHLLPRCATSASDLPDNQPSDHDGFYYALFEKQIG